MKKILLLMGFCCTVSLVNAQAPQNPARGFQDSHHNTLGTLKGTSVYNNENKMICQFDREGSSWTVKNGQSQAVGYIVNGEFQDATHKTVGYTEIDRSTYVTTVKDGSHTVVGYIKPGGIVENSTHAVVGYTVQAEPIWGAAYFFLMKF